jgi:hypothetical protein
LCFERGCVAEAIVEKPDLRHVHGFLRRSPGGRGSESPASSGSANQRTSRRRIRGSECGRSRLQHQIGTTRFEYLLLHRATPCCRLECRTRIRRLVCRQDLLLTLRRGFVLALPALRFPPARFPRVSSVRTTLRKGIIKSSASSNCR